MQINPDDQKYNPKIDKLRKQLQLDESVEIYPYGIETTDDQSLNYSLRNNYDLTSLSIRTRADFILVNKIKSIFLEYKSLSKFLEAVPLLYAKCLSKMGINYFYCFPNFVVNAKDIPMTSIVVPLTYQEEFKKFQQVFIDQGCKCIFLTAPIGGSGDPFINIDEGFLQKLSVRDVFQ